MGKSGKEMSAMERYWHNQKQRASSKNKTKQSKKLETFSLQGKFQLRRFSSGVSLQLGNFYVAHVI